jgi:hypothetical protein
VQCADQHFFAYSDYYLIDVKVGIIMDVEASHSIRQAEVGASKTMIERTQERFDIKPERLAGDTAYGSGANLDWLVKDKDIAPHIPVIDKSKREDGTFNSAPRWWMTQRPWPCIGAAYDHLRGASIVPRGADHRKAIGSREVARAVRIHAGRAYPPRISRQPQAQNADHRLLPSMRHWCTLPKS